MGSYDEGGAGSAGSADVDDAVAKRPATGSDEPGETASRLPGQRESPADGQGPTAGIMALSPSLRVVAALSLALVALLACVHLGMVFLHVAPSNTVTKQYGKAVDAWVYPEFEQNWKLFAPNPLQQNVSIQVKADIRTPDGGRGTTGWIDLSAQDAQRIRGNPLPSHVQQNELRRAWDFYTGSHDARNRPSGPRGELSESYVRRIAMLRLDALDLGGTVERIRLRSSTSVIAAPPWSREKTDTRPVHRTLPWWTVAPADRPAPAEEDSAGQAGRAEQAGPGGRTDRAEAGR